MDIGTSSAELTTYGIIGALFSVCIIFPPQEFGSAGFTIPKIFSSFLGDERFSFVRYQLRRTSLTIFIHCSLPFLFCIALELLVPERVFSFDPINFVQYFALSSLLLSIAAATFVFFLSTRDWEFHHIVRMLSKFNTNWRIIADEIDDQVRTPINFTINYNAYSRVIVTSEWLIRISNYSVLFARISNSRFTVVDSNKHPYLSTENNGMQLIDVLVESISNTVEAFMIRVHSQEMLNTLREHLARPIDVPEALIVPLPLHDQFVMSFLEIINENPKFPYLNNEPCLGCSAAMTNVKLNKRCVDPIVQDQSEVGTCQVCYCRPMWCARCMGRIFASKQNQATPEVWMSGRAPCPTCRADFCVWDVCYLDVDE